MLQPTSLGSGIINWPDDKRASLFRCINNMNNSNSCWTRNITARLSSTIGGTVINVVIAVKETLKLPFQALSIPLKLVVKTARIIYDANWLQKLDHRLSGISDLFKSAFKAFGAAFAAVFSLTIGFLSPRANVALHRFFGFVRLTPSAITTKQGHHIEEINEREQALISLLHKAREMKERELREEEARRAAEALAAAKAAQEAKIDDNLDLFLGTPSQDMSAMELNAFIDNGRVAKSEGWFRHWIKGGVENAKDLGSLFYLALTT